MMPAMINAKSYLAARDMRDIFAMLGWAHRGITAEGVEVEERIAISYRSETLGQWRCVLCDPRKLAGWLHRETPRPGCWPRLLELLDRKAHRPAPPQQQLLFPPGEAVPRVVKNSLKPQ